MSWRYDEIKNDPNNQGYEDKSQTQNSLAKLMGGLSVWLNGEEANVVTQKNLRQVPNYGATNTSPDQNTGYNNSK